MTDARMRELLAEEYEAAGFMREATILRQNPTLMDAQVMRAMSRAREEGLEDAANIALAIDSNRGNEKEIAKAIRALASGDGEVPPTGRVTDEMVEAGAIAIAADDYAFEPKVAWDVAERRSSRDTYRKWARLCITAVLTPPIGGTSSLSEERNTVIEGKR